MEQFFRTHYRSMVNYCDKFGFNTQDVEEMAVDVVMRDYEAHAQKGLPDELIRRYLNRRVMLNIKSMYAGRKYYSRTIPLDEEKHEQMTLDDPSEIVSLSQRVPKEINPILISYQQFKGKGKGPGKGAAKGENNRRDVEKFCRERKKFMALLGT